MQQCHLHRTMVQQKSLNCFSAAKVGNVEVLQEFLSHGFPIDVQDHSGYTALMMASYYGQKDAVKVLLEQGANRCLRDKRGHTALMGPS